MKSYTFNSVFKEEILKFIAYRTNAGIKQIYAEYYSLKQFDDFALRYNIKTLLFTRRHAVLWKKPMSNETENARYHRINRTKRFIQFLYTQGYNVYVFWDIRIPKTDFVPHIYSDDEIVRYFNALDTAINHKAIHYEVQFPVLFRLLYCCGMRIEETLNIRKRDVDLDAGVIKLIETKNKKERYIVLSKSMHDLMLSYADKVFFRLNDSGFIFHTSRLTHIDTSTVHKYHVSYLKRAGITYKGEGNGPRIHDWRHTFAVQSFKNMIDKGMDLYVALPILSTYLGHKAIKSTEKYVRLTMSMYPYIEERFKNTLDDIFTDCKYEND